MNIIVKLNRPRLAVKDACFVLSCSDIDRGVEVCAFWGWTEMVVCACCLIV